MSDEKKKGMSVKDFILLHIVFLIISLGSVASKVAASYPFLSVKFLFFYGLYIASLGVYAISWVQIIKRIPLVTAFSNKAVMVIWSTLLGALFFNETITVKSLVAAMIVIVGVILVVTSDE